MPDLTVHETTAANNLKVAMDMLERASRQFDVYAPWAVTAAFYSAVHLVEGIFYLDSRKHSRDHYERNDLLHVKSYTKIWTHYRPLYTVSMTARYLTECGNDDVSGYFTRHFKSVAYIRSQFIDHHLHQIQKLFEERKHG